MKMKVTFASLPSYVYTVPLATQSPAVFLVKRGSGGAGRRLQPDYVQ